MLRELNGEGTTIVQVTHSEKNAGYGSRVVHLLDGKVKSGGRPVTVWRNNLIVAWRNLRRYRMYTAINVGGLAAAYVVTIFVGLYVHSELTWDRFHAKGEQIYQVYVIWRQAEDREALRSSYRYTPKALGAEMVATVPGVLSSVRINDEQGLLSFGDRVFEERGLYADPGFFEFFSFPLIAGDPGTALDASNSIVLSKRLARRLFGDGDPMGQTVQLGWRGAGGDFLVTGVAADVPYESSLRFDWLIPFVHLELARVPGPWQIGGETFLQIADAEAVEAALAFDLDRYMEKDKHGDDLALVPLFDKRLHHQLREGGTALLYNYGFVAFLVLLLACINFANLAAGMSLTRAREVGVRKVIGAGRGQLVRQYFAESLLISFGALALAVPLTEILLPGLNRLGTFGEVVLQLDMSYTPWTVAALAGLGVVMGLLAGAYPALVQSRMRPVEILRDRVRVRSRAGHVLVVVQFAASTVFLTTALVVGRQVDHWTSLDQGYDPSLVVCIPTLDERSSAGGVHESRRFLEIFRREVLPLPGVLAVSGSAGFVEGSGRFHFRDRERPYASEIEVDPHFPRILGLELIEGQDFPPDLLTSGNTVLVNQGLAAQLEGRAIGAELQGTRGRQPRIIGVISDFEHKSYIPASHPLVLSVRPDRPIETVLVRLRPGDVPGTLSGLREAWDRLSPEVPFSYRFLEDHIGERFQYRGALASRLRWLAGFLALISCLGVFGMTSLAVSRRTKEVGVRKVHGASTAGVAVLLSSQSTRLVMIAVVIATPLAFQLSEHFLATDVNRIELDLLSYSAGGLITLGLTWLVTAYHAVRAALVNPVDSLRSE